MKPNKLKIIHVLPAWYRPDQFSYEQISNVGGGERYAAELALHLSELAPTTLLTFGSQDYRFRYKNLEILVVKCRPFLPRVNGAVDFFCWRLFRILKNFDVIHAYQYYADSTFLSSISAKLNRRKIFITDLGWRGINLGRLMPLSWWSDGFLVLSDYEKSRFGQKTSVIGAGVNLEKYQYTSEKKRQIMFIGRLLPHKGVDYLIDALNPDRLAVIAGHKYNDEYFELLKRKARGKRVKFLLSASDEEIIDELRQSMVLVLPSVDIDCYGHRARNPELFGLVAAEAFACGTPVIASNSSALPFVVDQTTGFIVAQNNSQAIREKIELLAESPDLVQQLGRNARAKAEKVYNWKIVAHRCYQKYIDSF